MSSQIWYHTRMSSNVGLPHLRQWREYAVLTLRELAAQSGVSADTILMLELGRQRAHASTVGKLSQALGITRRRLVYEQPPASEGQ
jgi:transcriptional regulator with XRE-family HTH domain